MKFIAIDCETKSLTDKTIIAVSFSTGTNTVSIPVRMNTTNNQPIKEVIDFLRPIIRENKIIFHNSSFDIPALVLFGIPLSDFKNIDDTVIISQLLDENIRHGLKGLTKRYFHHIMKEYKEVCGTGKKQISFADVEWKIAEEVYILQNLLLFGELSETSLFLSIIKIYGRIQ